MYCKHLWKQEEIGQVVEMKEVIKRLQAKSLVKLKREEDLVKLGHKGREGINVE